MQKKLNSINVSEKQDRLDLSIDKSYIEELSIDNKSSINLSEINGDENQSNYIISFKKLQKSENYIHVDIMNNSNITVLISKKENPYKYKVVINPGHGGVDVGGNYGSLYEKDLTLKIALPMEDILRFNGCEPLYTRTVDDGLDFIKSASFANDNSADLFVSIHINSGDSKEYNGVQTCIFPPISSEKKKRTDMASVFQNEILKSDNWKDMGVVERPDLVVLNSTNMPSVLLECGFILNENDRKKLLNDETIYNLSENISNAAIKYLNQSNPK